MIRIDENSVRRDIQVVTSYLNKTQRKVVPAAAVSALNKTAANAQTDTVRALAAKYRVSQKILRGVRENKKKGTKGVAGRVLVIKANYRTMTAWLSAKVQAIKASKLGKPKQLKKGVRVGSYRYDGAFVARMNSGHVGVYKRKGGSRLPIAEQVIKMPDGETIAQRNTAKRARVSFPKHFLHELKWRLSRLRR